MWILLVPCSFNLKHDGSNSAVVIPHGGPTGQMVDYWNTDVAALTSRGYKGENSTVPLGERSGFTGPSLGGTARSQNWHTHNIHFVCRLPKR